jgi:hypothetical protein
MFQFGKRFTLPDCFDVDRIDTCQLGAKCVKRKIKIMIKIEIKLRHEAMMKSCLPKERRPFLQQNELTALNKERAGQCSKGRKPGNETAR